MDWPTLRARRRDGPGIGAVAVMALLAFFSIRGCSPPPSTGPSSVVTEPSARLQATVTRVADGDTISVRIGDSGAEEEIRMIGVDTPETVDPDEPVQCFGPEASDFTHKVLSPGTEVALEVGAEARDAYGRLLAYVYLGGRMVNATLVRRGLARPLTIAPNDAKAALFERLALAAAQRRRGLWLSCPA